MRYPFEKQFLVCIGKRCNSEERGDQGGEQIQAALKDLNRQMGRKPTVRVCKVSCLDLCEYGPNILVWPDGRVYSGLDLASAIRVYHGEMGDGPPATDKELQKD